MLIIPLILLLFLCSLSADPNEHHAAARLRLNRPFFLRAGRVAKRVIDRLVPDFEISDIHASALNYFSFDFRRITLNDLDFPRTRFAISENGLNLHSTGGSVIVGLDFEFHYPPFTTKFFANVTIEDLRTNVLATLTTNNSRPHIEMPWCDARLGSSTVAIDDKHNSVYNSILKGFIAEYIRGVVKHHMCLFLSTASDLANEFINEQPADIRLYRNIYLNYTADDNPVFNEDYVEAASTFRADLIGKYSDPETETSNDWESRERNIARRMSFAMKQSPTWKKFKAEAGMLNLRAFIQLVMWLLVAYVVFKVLSVSYRILRKDKDEAMTAFLQLLQLLPLIPFNSTDSQVQAAFRLEKPFFEQASGEIEEIINYEVPRIQFPLKPIEKWYFSLSSRWIKVVGLDAPKVNFTISNKGFEWKTGGERRGPIIIDGGSMRIAASLSTRFLAFHKTGEVLIEANNILSDIGATIANHGGRPQIVLRYCDVRVSSVNILEIDAGITGFFVGFLSGWFEGMLKAAVPNTVCNLIDQYFAIANNTVMAQPESIAVWRNVSVNYKLSADPIFRDGAVEVTSTFNVSSVDNDEDCDVEEEFPELETEKDHSSFTFPWEEMRLLEFIFILISSLGATLLILDSRYALLIVLGCILAFALLLLLIADVI